MNNKNTTGKAGTKHAAITPERRRELMALAKKIDAKEKGAIIQQAQVFFSQHELVKQIVGQIKSVREGRGYSVTEIGNKSGIGKANVSRLENGQTPNPTFDTLYRYAHAVGVQLHLTMTPIGTNVETRAVAEVNEKRSALRKVVET